MNHHPRLSDQNDLLRSRRIDLIDRRHRRLKLAAMINGTVSAGIVDDAALAAVLGALRASGFWERYEKAIVSYEGIGLVVRQSSRGQALAEYALLAPEDRLAPVPAPEHGRLRFAEALPASVETAAERGLVLLCDVSAALPPTLPRWSRDDLQAILVLGSTVFRQGSALNALVEFLRVACSGIVNRPGFAGDLQPD